MIITRVKDVSPSLMCGDWLNIKEIIKELEAVNVQWLHIDVMDGHFVQNITFGLEFINQIKKATSIHLDIHMMVDDPMLCIQRLNVGVGDLLYFHIEALEDAFDEIKAIRAKGATPGLALLPGTPISSLDPYIKDLGIVLQMMTVPGFFGRPMEDGMLQKIGQLRRYLNLKNPECLISVDGSVSMELAGAMSAQGANIFVAGTSSIFKKNTTLSEGIQLLTQIVRY